MRYKAKNNVVSRYQQNSYNCIMKLAIIFLCLGIASCFVFHFTIYRISSKNVEIMSFKNKVDYVARSVYGLAVKSENLKNCPESEKKAVLRCLIKDLHQYLSLLSVDINCTLEEIYELLEIPLSLLNILTSKTFEVISVEQVDVLVKSVCTLSEGLLASVGVLLKSSLQTIENTLGLLAVPASIISSLHDNIADVLSGLTTTVLGNALGLVGGLTNLGALSSLTNVGGGLLGGGLLNVFGG
ncbi:uncharacterized protein LOC130367473 [Hyla sarda]|uniref:uncharacterized protein LOC130367473 n=1 Tax=Hyla sarda TaxID=327740 RepID=UPI0024C397E5|nr:uncharacterized protein LOC130367473 [Hyla sarda]